MSNCRRRWLWSAAIGIFITLSHIHAVGLRPKKAQIKPYFYQILRSAEDIA
jgi:hypothetical protein